MSGQPRPKPDRSGPEFDAYAEDYSGGLDNPIKGLLGDGLDDFIEVKAEWLLRDLARAGLAQAQPRLLDFGCGNAVLLRVLERLGYGGRLEGCDVSSGMLAEAVRHWPDGAAPPLHEMRDGRCPLPDAGFDVVVSSGVFHHIPLDQRAVAFGELFRLTRPGGRVYIFEHNPYNPLTQWVVKRTPIDDDAILLRPKEVRRGFRAAGLVELRTDYLMFVPPKMRRLRKAEPLLRWLPMGGQYVVSARRPAAG